MIHHTEYRNDDLARQVCLIKRIAEADALKARIDRRARSHGRVQDLRKRLVRVSYRCLELESGASPWGDA